MNGFSIKKVGNEFHLSEVRKNFHTNNGVLVLVGICQNYEAASQQMNVLIATRPKPKPAAKLRAQKAKKQNLIF